MAVISHRHRCIYVKVPKCASTTVRDWFVAHAGGRHSFRPWWYPGPLPERIQSVARLLELYPGYFTFAFLRNPYARFVSFHVHAERFARVHAAVHPDHPESNGTMHEFAELCGELLADTRTLWGDEARTFLREHRDRRYGPRGIALRYLSFVFNHVRPQVDYLPDCNPGRLFGVARSAPAPLSFIGAVETLDADFDRLRDVLGLPGQPLPRHNASAPAPCVFETLRRDAAMRRLVAALYADDLAFTGCGLDDAPAARRRIGEAPPPAAGEPPSLRVRLSRARVAVAAFEIGVVERTVRGPRVSRALAPLARLRRRLV